MNLEIFFAAFQVWHESSHNMSESIQISLWLSLNWFTTSMNRFMFVSCHLSLSRLTNLSISIWIDSNIIWIDSILHLGNLNRFKYLLTCINPHSIFLGWACVFSVSESIHYFIESIQSVALVRKLCPFFPYYIYTPLSTTSKLLNHLHLFSLGLKNSLLIHSSRLNTFS